MEKRRAWELTAIATACALVLTLGVVVAWSTGTGDSAPEETIAEEVAAPPPMPPAMTITPGPETDGVDPLAGVSVRATAGSLAEVSMVNDAGRLIEGVMSPDQTLWTPGVPLGYGRTYTLTATGQGTDATTTTQVSQFSTVVPQNQTQVSLRMTSGAALAEGATYGVGTVIVAQFDAPIPDRAAAERQLKVTTSPPVEGAWSWVNDQKAHWRPREYYPAGTEVNVEANIYGVALGDGLYGQQDEQVSFQIGRSRVTIADDNTKQISVYQDGELIRTMPTSMGRGGTETVNGRTIAFWTQPGTYTVMEKENPVWMDSSTYGLPTDAASGYRILVPYAVRISPNGIYVHQLEDTVWAQGNTNVSAGCLNLSAVHAKWFYEFSQPGDVVEVRNTGGAPLEQWNNGDWSVPWSEWTAASALNT